ncbi:MAG: Bor family protein [Bacteroidota bacterium]
MRNFIKMSVLVLTLTSILFSCYTYEATVGEGPQGNTTVKKKNHYLIYGLAPLSTADPNQMAGGAEDYGLKVTHTFVDGLINSITFGIYSPTTTIVTK